MTRRRGSKAATRPRMTMAFAKLCKLNPRVGKLAEEKAATGYRAPRSAVIYENKTSYRVELVFTKTEREEGLRTRWFDTHVYVVPKPQAAS